MKVYSLDLDEGARVATQLLTSTSGSNRGAAGCPKPRSRSLSLRSLHGLEVFGQFHVKCKTLGGFDTFSHFSPIQTDSLIFERSWPPRPCGAWELAPLPLPGQVSQLRKSDATIDYRHVFLHFFLGPTSKAIKIVKQIGHGSALRLSLETDRLETWAAHWLHLQLSGYTAYVHGPSLERSTELQGTLALNSKAPGRLNPVTFVDPSQKPKAEYLAFWNKLIWSTSKFQTTEYFQSSAMIFICHCDRNSYYQFTISHC